MVRTVYEIGARPSDGFFICLGLLLVGCGALLLHRRARRRRGFVLVWGTFLAGLGTVGAIVSSGRHLVAYRAYRTQAVEVLQGTVHVLRRQLATGHSAPDIIQVQGRSLEVDHYSDAPGYKETLAHGGALDEGVRVRLATHEGRILRLDVLPPN